MNHGTMFVWSAKTLYASNNWSDQKGIVLSSNINTAQEIVLNYLKEMFGKDGFKDFTIKREHGYLYIDNNYMLRMLQSRLKED